MTDEIM